MIKKNNTITKSTGQGIRAIQMLVFWVVSRFTISLLFFLAAFQLVCAFTMGGPNEKVMRFGKSLGLYVAQCIAFLT